MRYIVKKCLLPLLGLALALATSCSKDEPNRPAPTPSPSPTPATPAKMTASVSSLTMELHETKEIRLTNAPNATIEPLDGITAVVSGSVVKVTLNKLLTTPLTLIIKSGTQKLELPISMSPARAINAGYGLFRADSQSPLFAVAYATKKFNTETSKLDYMLLSAQKIRPLERALKLSQPSITGTQASIRVKSFGNFSGSASKTIFSDKQEQTLSGTVLISTAEKLQIRVKLADDVAYDLVFPNR